ncbi:hypothetical protein BCR43DRAFT_516872 [Syncephalastrum racemosum]|uniref:Uncharacterized protein n=1 Tax=Syncephalastrum racemosum TaxID=13706 RepID=A0A1X2H5W9_SYNRA|nr:hypothetical protein BCR43DRAFT_516872 [Syncephalastrum racemosum]
MHNRPPWHQGDASRPLAGVRSTFARLIMRSILFLTATTVICLSGAVFAQDAKPNPDDLQASGADTSSSIGTAPRGATDAVGGSGGGLGGLARFRELTSFGDLGVITSGVGSLANGAGGLT